MTIGPLLKQKREEKTKTQREKEWLRIYQHQTRGGLFNAKQSFMKFAYNSKIKVLNRTLRL